MGEQVGVQQHNSGVTCQLSLYREETRGGFAPAPLQEGTNGTYSDAATKLPKNALFLSGLDHITFSPSPEKRLSTVWAGMA